MCLFLQCVQYVDSSVLPELVPRLVELVKSGIGVGTKVSGCLCACVLKHVQ